VPMTVYFPVGQERSTDACESLKSCLKLLK